MRDGSIRRRETRTADVSRTRPTDANSRKGGVMKKTRFFGLLLIGSLLTLASAAPPAARWPEAKANEWYGRQPWLVGSNYIPATAINELEMWQAETFDPKTIDRELGWAEGLGFTSVRVFLHDLPWKNEHEGFLERLEIFLKIADRHHIGVMFVLMDSVWNPFPKAGPQQPSKMHLHNAGWVQSPGLEILKDLKRHGELEGYVKGVIGHFKNDRRVQAWDLMN